jgi:predicted DNA-binding transcriptional regulator YafY
MSDPTARVLQLLSLLQTHKFWPGTELSERLEVSGRTLRRDVDRLRELGYPVDATPGVAGGYRLAAGAHMPPLLLDDDEAVAIAVGLRQATGASVAGIEDTALRAMAKLEQVLPDRLRRRVTALHANVVPLRWSGGEGRPNPTVEAEALAILAQACRDHEELRFDYTARAGEATRRLVRPHQLVSAGRRWYLVAFDVRRDDWRTFRVDRMTEPRLAGARFPPLDLPGGDAAAFVAHSLGSRPFPHFATFLADGAPDEVRQATQWAEPEVEGVGPDRSRVTVKAEAVVELAAIGAILATRGEVTLEASSGPEVVAALAAVAERLGRAVSPEPGSAPRAAAG